MFKSKKLPGLAMAGVLAVASASAGASTVLNTWTFGFGGYSGHSIGNGDYRYTDTSNGETLHVDVSGFRISSSNGNTYTTGVDRFSSGIGIDRNESAPEHGVDNDGSDEYLIFDFKDEHYNSHDVMLDSFKFGYARESTDRVEHIEWRKVCKNGASSCSSSKRKWVAPGDSRYNGRNYGTYTEERQVWDNQADAFTAYYTESGWEILGNFLDVPQGIDQSVAAATSAAGNPTSDRWAIGAFIASLSAGPTFFDPSVIDHFADNFKLKSITVSKIGSHEVPVPATFALLLAGLALVHRRGRQDSRPASLTM